MEEKIIHQVEQARSLGGGSKQGSAPGALAAQAVRETRVGRAAFDEAGQRLCVAGCEQAGVIVAQHADALDALDLDGETGILAVGRLVPQPVVHDGAVVIRRRMRLTMSCDHRVIDGATGARFLQTLKGMLENPLAMVY